MPNLYDLCSGVRLKLSDPRAGRPGDAQLLDQVCMQIRTIKRQQRNTSNPWAFADTTVDVVPGEGTYQISTADFGTPLAVLTWAPDLPTWIARLIPFYQPQNIYQFWELPNNWGNFVYAWDGSNCTASRCAFYWQDGQPFIQFLPVPQVSPAQYKIRYLQSANGVNTAALTETIVSNEDSDIVQVRAAIGLVSTAEWQAPDSKDGRSYNAERRKDLAMTLANDEQELKRQFDAAQLIVDGPVMTHRPSVADWSG